MILTKAYITSLPDDGDNHFKVRVPLMEDNTGTEAIFSALLCTSPSTFNGYKVGDTVYVHFEDDQYNECVILGKLFTEVPTESSAYVLANELKVTDHAYLPPSTRLGDYTAQDLTNLYSAAANGGSGTGTVNDDDLKEYVKWKKTTVDVEGGDSYDIYANKIRVMPANVFDNIAKEEEAKSESERWTDSDLIHTLFFLTSVPEILVGTTNSDNTNVYSSLDTTSTVLLTYEKGITLVLNSKETSESGATFYSYQTSSNGKEIFGYIIESDLTDVKYTEYGPEESI